MYVTFRAILINPHWISTIYILELCSKIILSRSLLPKRISPHTRHSPHLPKEKENHSTKVTRTWEHKQTKKLKSIFVTGDSSHGVRLEFTIAEWMNNWKKGLGMTNIIRAWISRTEIWSNAITTWQQITYHQKDDKPFSLRNHYTIDKLKK